MLIDWLTLYICSSKISPSSLDKLRSDSSWITCISPSGEVEWEQPSRVSIKSDTHQLHVAVGGFIRISGSPARFMPDTHGIYDNVFGSMDIVYCANLMLGHVAKTLEIELPEYNKWDLSRIDVTQNYFLKGGAHDVEQVLSHWRKVEMGKYKTSTFDDSIYVQKGNKINAGKAYYKGKQLLKDYRKRFPDVMKQIKEDYCFDEVAYQCGLDMICNDSTLNDLEIIQKTKLLHDIYMKGQEVSKRLLLANGLLRLEATFGSRYWNERDPKTKLYLYRKKSWYLYTKQDLIDMFEDYFDTRFGRGVSVNNISNLKEEFQTASLSLGFSATTGLNAYKTLGLIKQLGKFAVYSNNNDDSLLPKSTFYKHRKIAMKVGLTLADFEGGEVIPFTRRNIDMLPVSNWHDLQRLAS